MSRTFKYKCNTCGNEFNIKDMITVRTALPAPADIRRNILNQKKATNPKTILMCKNCASHQ